MYKIFLPFLFVAYTATAQNNKVKKVAEKTSLNNLKSNLFFLASDEMEGRMTASRGDTMASDFIAAYFKEQGLQAPYNNGTSYMQAVPLLRKAPSSSNISFSGNDYKNFNGWSFSQSISNSISFKELPVVFAGYGISHERYNDLQNIDVKGKAVIVVQGQPKMADGNYLLSGNASPAILPSVLKGLQDKGALAILIYSSNFSVDSIRQSRSTLTAGFNTVRSGTALSIPTISLSAERLNALLAPANTNIAALLNQMNKTLQPQSMVINNTISIDINLNVKKEAAPNVIGLLNGTDTTAGFIILSAHHDHVGKTDGVIFPGAVDNASGTVAIMEVARLMKLAADKGMRPKRTIVFASFTGEEIGLVGSSYHAEHPVLPLQKAHAMLNIDMMGRVDTFRSGKRADSLYAYILVKDTLGRGLRKALFDAHAATGEELVLDPYYEQPQFMMRRLTGSDQYPFYLKGVPFLRIDCGFSKDYHKATDTPDKINYALLQKQVKLAFLTVWNLANN